MDVPIILSPDIHPRLPTLMPQSQQEPGLIPNSCSLDIPNYILQTPIRIIRGRDRILPGGATVSDPRYTRVIRRPEAVVPARLGAAD